MRSHFTVLLISDGQISDCVVFWSPVSGYIFPGFQYQPLQSLPENNCHSRKSLSIISRGSALDTAFLLPWKAVSSDCIWCCGGRQLKQDMDMVRLPVELYQISPETLLYQIFRMNLKKVHDPGTDDLPPVFDYKNGMVCKTAYRVCPPTINSFLF